MAGLHLSLQPPSPTMSYTPPTHTPESSSSCHWSKLTSRPSWSTPHRTTTTPLPTPDWQEEHTMFTNIPIYYPETIDETENNTTERVGDGFRAILSRSIHENTNPHSDTNRIRLDELHRSIAWADVMLRLKYYKARTAIRRTRKSISESICPNH
ncbi:hypothetical protein BDN71DRAFT_1441998 [Pleurotus eryngii]|uniref:Uncharacterized protein n=1 Tax=Pleurotus eryngii TaxID=5323 RepID=A0A9P6A4C8_PLEER|nr:hypothetical protein BDN71DRAFT_1441998 [Pleurotus eryngii]